ncbi:MAG: molecular chaperone SurA [Gammaproteobacteria bacterium]|nr:molecular chaperone SurA [Gammaproteobacteria bacterium]
MRKHILLSSIALLIALIQLVPAYAEPEPIDRIIAIVNDDVILQSELDNKTRSVRQQLRDQGIQPPSLERLQSQVLERLVTENLQLQLAERSGIKVDNETLNNNLRNLAQKNNLTLKEFRVVLERDGYTYANFRNEVRTQIILKKLQRQSVANQVQVSQQEIDNLLANQKTWGDVDQEYHVGHILIPNPEAASPEQIQATYQTTMEVLKKLQDGASFSSMAVAYSAGKKALEGGDIGWRKRDQIPTMFVDIIQNMQPGELSKPIRSPSGFHIIKLIDKRGSQPLFISQTLVQHILMTPNTITTRQAIKLRLEQLRTRIKAGEDFATLALSHSQDKISAADGGKLGWISPGEYPMEFEQAMNKLAIGEISEPLRTPFGYHLIRVIDRRNHDSTQDYQQAKARNSIRQRKIIENTDLWLRRLRDEAYIEYRIETHDL